MPTHSLKQTLLYDVLKKKSLKSTFYCFLAHLLPSANVIIWFMLSLLFWPKVITLRDFFCIFKYSLMRGIT